MLIAEFFATHPAQAISKNNYKNSVSLRFGLNGATQVRSSYGLAFLPPDASYARELFNNGKFNLTTTSFYDNIGVKVNETNFSYRVGQRFDIAAYFGKYAPYLTYGLGIMRTDHHYQISSVYGTGLFIKTSERMGVVEEVNLQKVSSQNRQYDIINI